MCKIFTEMMVGDRVGDDAARPLVSRSNQSSSASSALQLALLSRLDDNVALVLTTIKLCVVVLVEIIQFGDWR